MKLIGAFFRLVRWPNLVFIALSQTLFYYAIILPSFSHVGFVNVLRPSYFFLLSFSCVLIAAAGYIINDYFDLNIDRVNKPQRLVVEKLIRRRWAIAWHLIFSIIGVLIGLYISWKIKNIFVLFSQVACVLLLWVYSTTFKRKLLIGNIIISLLTAWVILVLYLCEFRIHTFINPQDRQVLAKVYKFAVLYGGFAFIISLVREIIKDIEDVEGDAAYGCRTMPIVWGIQAAKIVAATWLVVLMVSILILLFYVLQYKWWWVDVYSFFLIVLPLVSVLKDLYKASSTSDYHRLSTRVKLIMLAGILSMLLYLIPYYQ
ncbi:MAG: geranylgeranylglycerol-phosphate geranylgeranyltransferase [Bacteroidetes bacterium]|nr:geranylgeranylglycerol-phosphate geranylgeranyltransferase [Bacteroidota bacterium]